jgi:curli production assembly/transport component CsgF
MRRYGLLASVIILLGACSSAAASEIVYHPINPSFGGNPLNGSALLSQAQAQGVGMKSGSQGVDLSGLDNALSNLGSGAVIIGGTGTSGGSGSSGGGSSTQTNGTVRGQVF